MRQIFSIAGSFTLRRSDQFQYKISIEKMQKHTVETDERATPRPVSAGKW